MKLDEIYRSAIREGMKADPRGMKAVNSFLKEEKRTYRKLKGRQRSQFDRERLHNPYSDTRIHFGDRRTEVKKVMVGIDIETPEILLAEALNRGGCGIDLVVGHHPEGVALAALAEVMAMQTDILVKAGLKRDIARSLMDERMNDVGRGVQTSNHFRAVDSAKLLKIPFMNMHTVADNCVASFLQAMLDREKPKTAGAVMQLLNRVPEYKKASRRKAGPKLITGKKENKAGKILVDMTGGTGGPDNVFARLSQAGIGTIVGMHMSDKNFSKAKTEHINVIIAGHIASDNIGMNLLLDRLVKKADIKILACSGFTRVRR